ncbi:MAG: hypothetical protein HY907_22860 [Deltaproteobacteria bacterium]|nr:hypothetical protein [Deltaproteobacteria bacterium]
MGIGAVESGCGSVYAGAGAEGPGAGDDPAAVGGTSVADVAEVMVEADRQQRQVARETARTLTEAAHRERLEAIAEQRAAADDNMGSAIQALCIGLGSAALQAVSAGMGAAATSATQGAAGALQAGDTALQASLQAEAATAQATADACAITDKVMTGLGKTIDPCAWEASDHSIEAGVHSDRAQLAQDRSSRADADAEAARGARRAHIDSLAKAFELQDRGMTIAIGRESA